LTNRPKPDPEKVVIASPFALKLALFAAFCFEVSTVMIALLLALFAMVSGGSFNAAPAAQMMQKATHSVHAPGGPVPLTAHPLAG